MMSGVAVARGEATKRYRAARLPEARRRRGATARTRREPLGREVLGAEAAQFVGEDEPLGRQERAVMEVGVILVMLA